MLLALFNIVFGRRVTSGRLYFLAPAKQRQFTAPAKPRAFLART